MTSTLSLNYSFRFTAHENSPRRGAKKASEFINFHDQDKQNICNSVRTRRYPSKFLMAETSLSLQMEDLISFVERGSVENALQLFDEMNTRKSYLWNILIRALTNNGFSQEALSLYYRMCIKGVRADNFTFPFVIKAIGQCLDFVGGEKVHSKLFKVGLDLDVHISNSLILMYAKLGYIVFAEKVFDEMPVRDTVSWNSMINGYVLVGDGLSSLMSIRNMQLYKMGLDRLTIVSALKASSLVCSLPIGKEIHALVIKSNFECYPMVQTSLIDMYGKCNGVDYAERFFSMIGQRNVASWNAMIHGYALNGQPLESFYCLRKMQEYHSVSPDEVSLINLLPSCSQVGSLLMSKSVHGYAIRIGFLPHIVLETALVDLYGKCGDPKLAKLVFDRLSQRNLISCNTIISALVQNGRYRESLNIFRKILDDGLKPDATTITCILPAYSEIAQLREGKQMHGYIIKSSVSSNTFVLNSLTYMYAKCGDLQTSQNIFDGIFLKDVISWNTIIMAYAIHGYAETSINLFSKMNKNGMKPNASTFVSVLSSCSISGMVDEGWKFFISMKRVYGIDPGIEHYGCMVDLLGRIGDLQRAKHLITEMPLKPTPRIWGSLLSASRHHKNLELAEFAAKHMLSLEHDHTGLYILLSNLYAEAERWEDVRRIKSIMKRQNLTKTVGSTMVDVHGKTYNFTNQDRSHIDSNLIYNVLDIILSNKGDNPCVSSTKFKTVSFLKRRGKSTEWHSVRLAVCFGLISTSIGSPVLVRKNVRICEDCHGIMKKISVFSQREIVVGDSKIYHHFIHGQCSCRDYW